MAVAYVITFRPEPGKLNEHLAAMGDGLAHLRRLGVQAVLLQAIAGADAGSFGFSMNFADMAEFARSYQRVVGDADWQAYYAAASAGGSAVQTEASLFQDADASFQPAADRPLGVIAATQWRPFPGRIAQFMAKVEEGKPHLERLGGTVRVLPSFYGLHPNTVLISVTFADLDAWGAHSDAVAGDTEWQSLWADAMSDPTAEIVRTGVYVNVSDG